MNKLTNQSNSTQDTEDVVGPTLVQWLRDKAKRTEDIGDATDFVHAADEIQSLSDRIDVLEAENRQLQIDRVTTLAMFYSIAPGTIAKMCDEQLDKSGALLGMVRETAARAALHQEGIAP